MIFNDNKNKKPIHLFNYHFLKSIIVFLLIAIFSFGCRSVISEGNEISFGIITDLHYSNTPAHSNRLDSLNIAVQTWNDRGNVSFAVELSA